MYKIDRRGGGVQKSFSRTDPDLLPPLVAALYIHHNLNMHLPSFKYLGPRRRIIMLGENLSKDLRSR